MHYNGDNSYLLVNRKKSISLKQVKKMSTFHRNFDQEAYIINLNMLSQKKYL